LNRTEQNSFRTKSEFFQKPNQNKKSILHISTWYAAHPVSLALCSDFDQHSLSLLIDILTHFSRCQINKWKQNL